VEFEVETEEQHWQKQALQLGDPATLANGQGDCQFLRLIVSEDEIGNPRSDCKVLGIETKQPRTEWRFAVSRRCIVTTRDLECWRGLFRNTAIATNEPLRDRGREAHLYDDWLSRAREELLVAMEGLSEVERARYIDEAARL
jgi:hypothetical protein